MTVGKALAFAEREIPGALTLPDAAELLSALDDRLYRDVLAPYGTVEPPALPYDGESPDTLLMLRRPYSMAYRFCLLAEAARRVGDGERYAHASAIFNELMNNWTGYVSRACTRETAPGIVNTGVAP